MDARHLILFSAILCATIRSSSATTCSCGCYNLDFSYDNLDPEVKKQILELKKNLTISTKNTTSYKRSKISANDSRPSAQAVGSLGIVLLLVIGILVVLVDSTRLCGKKFSNYDHRRHHESYDSE